MKKVFSKNATLARTLMLAAVAVNASAADFFVSPYGSPSGNGSRLNAWDIATALGDNTSPTAVNKMVAPGDTIWLRAGMYGRGSNWVVTSKLVGATNRSIVVRQYPGERAVVDGGIRAMGAWTTFWGFEIMNSSTNRYVITDNRPPGINLLGTGHRCINLVIHDVGHPGIGFWSNVGDRGEIYGCIMWGNGIYSHDPGWNGDIRGSAIYAQNDSGLCLIGDVISFKNWTSGIKAYAEKSRAEGFHFDGNIVFGNQMDGILAESGIPITNAWLTGNTFYKNGLSRAGIYGQNHQSLLLVSNTWIGDAGAVYNYQTSFKGWRKLTMTNNTFVELSNTPGYAQTAIFWEIVRTNRVDGNVTALTAEGNHYFIKDSGTIYSNWRLDEGRRTFAQIQASGCEAVGTLTLSHPDHMTVSIRPNKYERGRAHVVVLNWQREASATVDVSNLGLLPGESFQVSDVQNYLGAPLLTAVYDPTKPTISIPLVLTECSQIIGDHHHFNLDPDVHTDMVFNTFVISLRRPATGLAPAENLKIQE